jgi:hypothetical protein
MTARYRPYRCAAACGRPAQTMLEQPLAPRCSCGAQLIEVSPAALATTPLASPAIPDQFRGRDMLVYRCPICFWSLRVSRNAEPGIRVVGREGLWCPACFGKWVPKLDVRDV